MKSSANKQLGFLSHGIAFVLGVVACAGLWVAWSLWSPATTGSDGYEQDITADSIRAESSDSAGLESASPDLDATTAETFEEIARIESGFSRNLFLYNFVLDFDEAQLLELIKRADSVPAQIQFETQRVIVERLYEIDPEFTLSHADTFPTPLVQFLFHQWAKSNLADAIERAKSLGGAAREGALTAILARGPELSDEQRVEIERELAHAEPLTGVASGVRYTEIQERDPDKRWNEALREGTFDSDHIRTLVISGLSWIRQSGFEAIDEISGDLENVQVREQVLTSELISASQFLDMEDIFAKSLELENDPDKQLLSSVVGYWSSRDPKSALGATNNIESYTLRNRLQQVVLHTWANREPRTLLDEIDRIPQNLQAVARRDALDAIAQNDPREAILLTQDLSPGANTTSLVSRVIATWAEQDPQAALAWVMNRREFEGGRHRLLSSVVNGWSKRDPNEALNWVLEQRGYPELRHIHIPRVLKQLAYRNPELALQRALEQPIEENQIGPEQAVVYHIAQSNLPLAREMLQQTREGITRQNSYAAVGLAMVRASRGVEAVELASDLRGRDREKYLASTLWRWVDFDATGLHDSLSNISDPEIRASAAAALIVRDNARDILNNEQKKFATEQLGGRDASSVVPELQTIQR
ncbi:MAG: hypothetical protein F4X44_12435 [Gammaproteobacteria bacterium]|nr:hypothetical protein [Gammaproteobacteria bacterium]MYD81407.1 hypothetical protein [Gammaproteobacteria bacterium]